MIHVLVISGCSEHQPRLCPDSRLVGLPDHSSVLSVSYHHTHPRHHSLCEETKRSEEQDSYFSGRAGR